LKNLIKKKIKSYLTRLKKNTRKIKWSIKNMFIATLNGIFRYKDLPEDMIPYVTFKATIESQDPQPEDKIAILDITGTTTHHVLFLNEYNNIEQIKDELKEEDAKINYETMKILEGHI